MRKFSFDAKHAFDIAVGLELIEGVNQFSSAGFSNVLDIDVETDIHLLPGPGTQIPLPNNSGETIEVVSDDPTDTGPVQIFVLGPDGVFIDPITVSLNGITPVALPGLISRINFARNMHPPGFNGTISIQGSGGGTIFANMLEQFQNTEQSMYTVPANKKGLLKTAVGSMRKQGGVETAVAMLIHVKPFDFDKFYHPFGFGIQRSGTTTVELFNEYPEAINGPFDISVSATATATGPEVSARIAGLIFDV
jgi:hypothetical protein